MSGSRSTTDTFAAAVITIDWEQYSEHVLQAGFEPALGRLARHAVCYLHHNLVKRLGTE